ncbi:MAG: hypothetical protein LBS11_00200 [Oscillospiraceae bacterium]|nr:hypothetical protein [Oscillospiraceae bacterium]
MDPVVNKSGKHHPKSNPSSKRGSLCLSKTLFQVICACLRCSPCD